MTTWRQPGTWSAGVVVTNSALNNEVRDQFNYLKAMPSEIAVTGGSFSTTTTAWSVINTAAFQRTITSYGGDIMLRAQMPVNALNSTGMFEPFLDGTGASSDYSGVGIINGQNPTYFLVNITHKFTGVASGVHTVGLHWRVVLGGTLGVGGEGIKQFEVREVTTSAV